MRQALLIFIFAFALPIAAQEMPTISVTTNLVTLQASVHDRSGRIINNLNAEDFVLEDNGIPQKIRYFSRESELPLIIGLLVDTSRSQTGVLNEEALASSTFLDRVLREGKDQAFIAHFDTKVQVLQGLTSSRSELSSALQRVSIPNEYATLLYSAVRDSSDNILRQRQGRKALVLLTDGVAYKDSIPIGTAIEFAQRADTILYSIRFSDPIAVYRPFRAAILEAAREKGKQGLEKMARETGGTSYEVTKNRSIEMIYSQIEGELRNQYSIGYTPSQVDGRYHKIRLVTKDHHLIVATRDGYFAK
jgi:VWFA-related protein